MADKFLFKIANDGVTSSPGLTFGKNSAPTLTPLNDGIVDIVNNFPWTTTGTVARDDTPRIYLKEYNVIRSSLFQQARYLLSTTPDVADALQQITQQAGVIGTTLIGGIAGASVAGKGKGLFGAAVGVGAAFSVKTGLASKVANLGVNAISKTGLTLKQNTNLKPYLQPYDQLYATTATGFQYSFPYFPTNWKNTDSSWDSLNTDKSYNKFDAVLKDMISGFNQGGIGGFTGTEALKTFFPAAYIETPKMFKYTDGSGEKLKFTFSLFNTTTYDDVIRNWQLCFLLMYQNRPNRSSRVLVDVPVIYEVNIPGIYYCPFAFINEIKIDQIGATRRMSIPLLTNNSQEFNTRTIQTPTGERQVNVRPVGGDYESTSTANFETLIPDSYEIEITITPLVSETRNLLYQTLTTNDSVYDVSVIS